MSLRARNRIVPQMADYDRVGDQWVPYLMRVDRPNQVFPSVSTDEYGFRRTMGADGRTAVTYARFMAPSGDLPRGVVLGSSAAFGVGATHDRHTVASVLNRLTALEWFNLSGRAFNSTQEVLQFVLHLPVHARKLVVFSGLNNLVLCHLAVRTSPVYNAFFYQSVFERAMQAPPDAIVGVRRSARLLVQELWRKIVPPRTEPIPRDIGAQYEDILVCFRRDLRFLQAVTRAHGAALFFALQPVATWIDKALTREEEQLFGILDRLSMDWQVLADHILTHRQRYARDVEAVCHELGVPFLDINRASPFAQREWLFADRVHLTNRGYEVAAEILAKEFKL